MHLLQGHNVFDTNRAAVAALRPDGTDVSPSSGADAR
jgi:hypothetical protein